MSDHGVSSELKPTVTEILRTRLAPEYELIIGALDQAPVTKGAYALILLVENVIALPWRTKTVELSAGCYVYAGNANGGGGIRSRLRHHVRPAKMPHWHIDHLTNAALQIWAFAGAGGSECDIVARLSSEQGFEVPLVGFGSSDCRDCRSHLLRYAPDDDELCSRENAVRGGSAHIRYPEVAAQHYPHRQPVPAISHFDVANPL